MPNDIAVPWRRFHDLVARIHTALETSGALIKSPDRLRDLQTGKLREVDATIRRKESGREVLITIEARRRKDTQDVTWIEQLSTKRRKVGADATIAVSASGFAHEAVVTAAAEGIIVATVEELEQNDLRWLNLEFADIVVETFFFERLGVELWDEPADGESLVLRDDLKRRARRGTLDYLLFIRIADGTRYSAGHVVEMARRQGFDPYEGLEAGHTSPRRQLNYKCDDRGIGVETTAGIKPVKLISIQYHSSVERRSMPISAAFRYSGTQGAQREGVEFDMSVLAPDAKLQFAKDLTTGRFGGSVIVRGGDREGSAR